METEKTEEPPPIEAAQDEPEVESEKPAGSGDTQEAKVPADKATAEQTPQKEDDKSDFYRAKIIRRASPPPDAGKYAKAAASATDAAKPTGVRVLKVVPGREGRGHQFIDLSKPDKQKKRTHANRAQRADFRDALFDAYTPGYTPGMGRRRRMNRMSRSKSGRKTNVTLPAAHKRVIKMVTSTMAASELAHEMGVKLREVNLKLRDFGVELQNMREDTAVDLETATAIAQEFSYEIQDAAFKESDIIGDAMPDQEDDSVGEDPRPPVVTVMGHVDHGKTSILDAIRKTKVTEGEAGGITQHIGAYEVQLDSGTITFIDTPGHEAFSAMRARGAQITDLVILVVAADDGIMPQTIEAINHAQAAEVPILVAVNKIDLPNAQPDRIGQEMTKHGLVPEAWGGDTIITQVSAKTKEGLDTLLENILVQAEVLELKAKEKTKATGTVIEARLDRGRGPVATLLVENGTLKTGDTVVVGTAYGRLRMMYDHEAENIKAQTPGRPVQVQGLNEVPLAGENFYVVKNEREAKKLVAHRRDEAKAARSGHTARLSLEDFYKHLAGTEKLELNVLIKADVQGTAEAVKQAVEKLSTPKVGINVIHHGVGAISETDVHLAAASGGLLVGFNIRPDPNAKKLAEKEKVDLRVYNIIYDLTQEIRQAQTGLLPATTKENVVGRAEVRDLFVVPKIGTVAGVSVVDGKMLRNAQVRLLRDNVEVFSGKLRSLRRFKDDVREVAQGYECGIGLENYNDIKRGDIVEAFVLEEERPSL